MNTQKLNFNLTFNDLFERGGLVRVDSIFCDFLKEAEAGLYSQLIEARTSPRDDLEESELILNLAPYVEDFLSQLFDIKKEAHDLQQKHEVLSPLYACKRDFVRRRVQKAYKPEEISTFEETTLKAQLESYMDTPYSELRFSKQVLKWMQEPETFENELEIATKFSAWSLENVHNSILFSLPKKTDPQNLIDLEEKCSGFELPESKRRHRDGFAHTDEGNSLEKVLDQATYCIYCHHQGRDSCSKGLKDKKTEIFKKNPLDVTLNGCPLDQKISEMNEVKSQGYSIGALAVIVIDNPMVAGTGHRICNDCSKACIYQKQNPVDIPCVETGILEDVLGLPYGFEIYSLLTRWNPLNFRSPLPKELSGYKVLVTGMGPAGYTLAHYLLNEGHNVVGIDGLKIEPIHIEASPIKYIEDQFDSLDTRSQAGFGGVAEYGITVRWNKNYLKIIRLLLERRAHFKLYGGVRLGSNITLNQAFEKGFDHVALCMGAGSPKIIPLKNNLAKGVRKASDFLMALQLTGAARRDSIANLQIRMPVVVIGGGLTAIDTATEASAYYITQIEKFSERYEAIDGLSDFEKEVADEFLSHASEVRNERLLAKTENRNPHFQDLINKWGGVSIAYRKSLQESPSYRLNHEEVEKAFEEGVRFIPNFSPDEVVVDNNHNAVGLKSKDKTLPAKAILIAAGTKPNTILAQEELGISVEGTFFKTATDSPIFVDSKEFSGRLSYFGDLHPSFNGNVVKAMASAKKGYSTLTKFLKKDKPAHNSRSSAFFQDLDTDLLAHVVDVNELAPKIIEVVVKAPLAAGNFQPGQFYRLQNYETRAGGPSKGMEGLALTGASVDKKRGTLSLIALEMGGSSNLCRFLKPNEPIVLMGPTGTPTEIPIGETVLLAGGGLGNAVLFSIGQAMRAAGSKVIYFAAYRKSHDLFKREEIEKAADQVIWVCEEKEIQAQRSQDLSFKGNIVEALNAYKGISLDKIDRLLTIGSDRMMSAVHNFYKDKPNITKIASINSPMQCMMKEICAQCLQKQVDPKTGIETYVFSCHTQDQPLDSVDFGFLKDRLSQNSLSEKVTAKWISRN